MIANKDLTAEMSFINVNGSNVKQCSCLLTYINIVT